LLIVDKEYRAVHVVFRIETGAQSTMGGLQLLYMNVTVLLQRRCTSAAA
jgi:hypothetical protein